MLFFKHRKKNDKRLHNKREVPYDAFYSGPEHRSDERSKNNNRRHNANQESGLYHRLSDQRKTTMNGIIRRLEDLLDEEKG
jgi:hypothetical protein